MNEQTHDLSTIYLLDQVEATARPGHFTIFRFTAHWKTVYGTPWLPGDQAVWEESDYWRLADLPGFDSLAESLAYALAHKDDPALYFPAPGRHDPKSGGVGEGPGNAARNIFGLTKFDEQ